MNRGDFGGSRRSMAVGVRWSITGRVISQVTRICVTLVLARLLGSEEFGLVGAALIVVRLLESLQDFGTGRAVVIRREIDRAFASSIFVLNAGIGVVLALALWAGSDGLALLYGQGETLARIFQVLGLAVLLTSLANAHRALLQRRMDFFSLALVDVLGALTNGIVAVGLALLGYGVWAMVIGILCSSAVQGIAAWVRASWIPRLRGRLSHYREVASFSLNLTLANLAHFLLINIDSFLITRYLGASAMGYYALAQRIVSPSQTIVTSLLAVVNPALAHVQDDLARVRREVSTAASGIVFVAFPFLLGVAIAFDSFTALALGPKWDHAVPIVRILVGTHLFLALLSMTTALFAIFGRTDLQLRWTFIQGICVAGAYWAGLRWGLAGLATGGMVATAAVFGPAIASPLRLISMPLSELFRALRPYLFLNAILIVGALGGSALARATTKSEAIVLAATVAAGAGAYGLATLLFRPPLLASVGRILSRR